MTSSLEVERKSPILNQLTRQRPESPGRRTPSRSLLRSSFNENDTEFSSISTKGKRDLSSTMSGVSGPPAVAKKPEVLKKPIVSKKPVVPASKPNGNVSSAFRDSLSKKLAVPLPSLGQESNSQPKNGFHGNRTNISNGNITNITKELDGILSKQHARTNSSDNPKSDKTISLTEVSTLRTEEKSTKQMNDTLEMMTDEGFDTTVDDNLNLNGDIDLSPDEDDDELFANFNIPPPPPPAVDFSDSEWDDSIFSKGRKDSNISDASITSGESLSCAFEAFVPPPPPPNLMNDTDDDDVSSDGSDVNIDFGDIEIPDFTDQTADNDSINSFGTIIRKPAKAPEVLADEKKSEEKIVNGVHPDPKRNSLVGELKGVFEGETKKGFQTPPKSTAKSSVKVGESNGVIHGDAQRLSQTPLKFNSNNLLVGELKGVLSGNNNSFPTPPKLTVNDTELIERQSSNDIPDFMNEKYLTQPIDSHSSSLDKRDSIGEINDGSNTQQKNINPLLGNLQGDIKSKNDNVLKEIGKINLRSNSLQSNSSLKISHKEKTLATVSTTEVDSGNCTARSVEVSDSEKNNSPTNSQKNSVILKKRVLRKSGSKTWSSCSSGLDDREMGDDEDDYDDDDESELTQPKVNLRDLLKKMKSFDSESEDDITASIRTNKKMDAVNNRNSMTTDDDDSVHLTDSDVETHLNDLEVQQWTIDDVGEWLDLIGLAHLQNVFARNKIDGKALAGVDMQLLENMKITNSEDREMILSEVYALQNPSDVDLQLSMLDKLDKATGEEKEKMLSFLNALEAPSNEPFISSYMLSTKQQQQQQQNIANKPTIVVQEEKIELTKENEQFSAAGLNLPAGGDEKKSEEQKTIDMMKKLAEDVFDPSAEDMNSSIPSSPSLDDKNNKKKTKKKGFFASLRRGKGKKSKPSNSGSNESESENAIGTIKVVHRSPAQGKEEVIPLLVTMKTSSKDVCRMCLDYLDLHEDVNCYHIVISRYDKKIENVELNADESPLVFQSKWGDLNTYRFELKSKTDSYIIVNNDDNGGDEELSNTKIAISNTTRVIDIIPVLAKKLKKSGKPKHFRLKQPDKDEYMNERTVILSLEPALGYKFHIFKFINVSPEASKTNTESRELRNKCSLLEKQIQVLNNQIEDQRISESQLKSHNQNLSEAIGKKNEEIKILQHELTNLNLTEKTRKLVSPSQEKELQLTNSNLNDELQKSKYQSTHLERVNSSLREDKLDVEKERDKFADQNKELLKSVEEMKMKLDQLQNEKKTFTAGSSEQMKKLYGENKELLKTIQSLEEKLSDAEYKCSQLQLEQETDGVETTELRMREEALENQVLEKDSKLLEMEYKVQKKERSIREFEDQLEEEKRKRKKELEIKETLERRIEELLLKLENSKQQLNEKDKQMQSTKNQLNKQEKKINKQRTIMEQEKYTQNEELQNLRLKSQSEIAILQEKIESLQKINVEKAMVQKEREFELTKKNEEYQVLISDYGRKLSAKDVLIERLESKVAKVDVNIGSKLQEQLEITQAKEEKIREFEMEIARLQSEHTSKLREATNNLRSKENLIAKLENRIKKLETNNRDGAKKFEKFSSEKERLLMQMNEDRDKEVKDLKTRLRNQEELVNEKEKESKEMSRKLTDFKKTYENRLKKRDKEYKQQKYLLEKILALVNEKAPSLLRQLQDSIDEEQSTSGRSSRRSHSRMEGDSNSTTAEDEWC